jgi:hypothetical protein
MVRPIGEMSAVLAALTNELLHVPLGDLSILVSEPVNFTYAVGNAQRLTLRGGCGATLDVTAGNIKPPPGEPGGVVTIIGCGPTTVRLGDVDFLQITGSQTAAISVAATRVARSLSVSENVLSSIAVTGSIPGVNMFSNSQISLSLPDVAGDMLIRSNHLPAGLSALQIGHIGGDLSMLSNFGFFDFEAQEWAAGRVGGSITIQGNSR